MALGIIRFEDKSQKQETFWENGEEYIRITSDLFEPIIFTKKEYEEYVASITEMTKLMELERRGNGK